MSEATLMKDLAALKNKRQSLVDEQRRGDVLDQEIQRANEALAAKQQQLFEIKVNAAQKQLDKLRRDEVALFDRLAKIGVELGKIKEDANTLRIAIDDAAKPVRSGDPLFGKRSIDILNGLVYMAFRMQADVTAAAKGHTKRRKTLSGYGR